MNERCIDPTDLYRVCKRHPINGGNCRFHSWPGNCDDGLRDVVQHEQLQAGRQNQGHNRFTNPGELVLDPFAGIMSVPYMAIKMGRHGHGVELNHAYWRDGLQYLRSAETEIRTPMLFDLASFHEGT